MIILIFIKKQKITETDFNFIDICNRNQDNKNIELKDFWQISVYIDLNI